MPCPKCDLGCAGAQALEMHESVCCGPLVEAAPLSAEQAAQLEAHTPCATEDKSSQWSPPRCPCAKTRFGC